MGGVTPVKGGKETLGLPIWDTVKEAVKAAQCLEDNDAVTELVETVARGVHKLTAYKDEYEVARLFLDAETKSEMIF